MLKEIKELIKWRDSLCWWFWKLSIVNSLQIYRFNEIPVGISRGFFIEIRKLFLNFIWKCEERRITKTSLKKNQVWSLTLPDFRAYYKAMIIKALWYWYDARQIYWWNRESREEKPDTYLNTWFLTKVQRHCDEKR